MSVRNKINDHSLFNPNEIKKFQKAIQGEFRIIISRLDFRDEKKAKEA